MRKTDTQQKQLELLPTVLDKAGEIIYGDREKTYGSPQKNFDCIAAMWTAFLRNRFGFEDKLTSKDVCYLMALLKVARLANNPAHEDSVVDGIGYLASSERVV
jgi:hypothetical protein